MRRKFSVAWMKKDLKNIIIKDPFFILYGPKRIYLDYFPIFICPES